jgi:hypothetical protein
VTSQSRRPGLPGNAWPSGRVKRDAIGGVNPYHRPDHDGCARACIATCRYIETYCLRSTQSAARICAGQTSADGVWAGLVGLRPSADPGGTPQGDRRLRRLPNRRRVRLGTCAGGGRPRAARGRLPVRSTSPLQLAEARAPHARSAGCADSLGAARGEGGRRPGDDRLRRWRRLTSFLRHCPGALSQYRLFCGFGFDD